MPGCLETKRGGPSLGSGMKGLYGMTFPQEITARGPGLSVLSRRNLLTSAELTPLQAQVDGLVNGFVREATDSSTLAALMAGGLAYRFGRIGVMAAGEGFLRPGFLLRGASVVGGFGLELGSYEFTRRLLSNDSNPNRWNWNGQGGWGQGLATSAITFGLLKSAGFVAREQNIAFQHLFQSTSMVLGHDAAASFGLVPHAEGSFAERLLHAEATNLQLGAGMGLVHSVAPGVTAFEHGLDLSLRNQTRAHGESPWGSLSPALAVSGRGRARSES